MRGPWPIDLAHTRAFRLGDVEVQPATREAIRGDRRITLDPKIMEVLVVLAAADGAILSRDDLITACWGGRAVTDDAINRVISRLRAVARDLGGFKVETITKVGYRLVEDPRGESRGTSAADAERQTPSPAVSRRMLVAGGAVVALGAGALLWRQPWRHRPNAEAVEYFRRAEIAHRQGVSNQSRQAIAFYQQVVRADPDYAEAWGGLALANTHLLEDYGKPEVAGVPGRLRSAARRALELDPNNADARLALILLKPVFRNWAVVEAELRQFNGRHPGHWLGMGRLGILLYDVGRLDEGIALTRRALEVDPMLPVGHAALANALLNAERLQEAEALLDRARERWPAHPSLWDVNFRYLLFTGQPESAAALLMDPQSRPSEIGQSQVDLRLRLARAVQSRQPAEVEVSVQDQRALALADVGNIPSAAAIFVLLGRPELAFDSLERYFFNRGNFGSPSPIEPLSRRYARTLFSPPFEPLRTDPRYASLIERIGLEDYWRKSGTRPDFRRG
ncbi:MAG TPA: winged helix-turn-helix domain-containing protein [Sphingomicrobium sp.]|nr:winged helix-turn-helix domain-containing protein [Sphingomicrobium sp.]